MEYKYKDWDRLNVLVELKRDAWMNLKQLIKAFAETWIQQTEDDLLA